MGWRRAAVAAAVLLWVALAAAVRGGSVIRAVSTAQLEGVVAKGERAVLLSFRSPCELCVQARALLSQAAPHAPLFAFLEIDVDAHGDAKKVLNGIVPAPDNPVLFVISNGVVSPYVQPMALLTSKLAEYARPLLGEVATKAALAALTGASRDLSLVLHTMAGATTSSEFKVFEAVCKKLFPDVTCLTVSQGKFAKSLRLKSEPSVGLVKPHEPVVVYSGDFDEASLVDFVAQNQKRVIYELRDADLRVFAASKAKRVLLAAAHAAPSDVSDKHVLFAKRLASSLRAKHPNVELVHFDATAKEFEHLKLARGDLPTFVLLQYPEGKKFVFDRQAQALDAPSVLRFVENGVKGRLKAFVKSEPPVEHQDGPVYVTVANTFESDVIDNELDVLVEFYAPWCGHCKKLAPIFDEIALHYQARGAPVRLAKMDATANDVDPALEIRGYPTLLLFKRGAKNAPVPYNGERTFAAITAFLDSHQQ